MPQGEAGSVCVNVQHQKGRKMMAPPAPGERHNQITKGQDKLIHGNPDSQSSYIHQVPVMCKA